MKKNRGFTLIELIVVMVVVVILATVAVPNFTRIIQENRMTADANELITLLNAARSEAVRLGGQVTANLTSEEEGWSGQILVQDEVYRQLVRNTAAVDLDGDHSIAFFADGSVPQDFSIVLSPSLCNGSIRSRVVSVAPTGRVSVTAQDCEQ
ncbi:GspH/FimT family pseudopilin [Alkalilimnicola ehrlichii]|nr:GspH/FimT family pseudopilin [Alkalilimnicola ehrlichii]